MKLCDQLTDYVNAAFTGLWVQSHEPDEAEREIVQHAKAKDWKVAVWDVANGLRFPNSKSGGSTEVGGGDPWQCCVRCRRWQAKTARPCWSCTTFTSS